MTELFLKNSIAVKTNDKKDVFLASATVESSTFNMGIQPASVMFVSEQDFSSINNQPLIFNNDKDPLWMLNIQDKDPWELFGSDHNSGMIWYGSKENIDSISPKVEELYRKSVEESSFSDLIDSDFSITDSPVVRWNFEDGSSLLISYTDSFYQNIDAQAIQAKDVVSFIFGGVTDDIMAHEILQPFIAKSLKKIKLRDMEVDFEELEDLEEYSEGIEVNGKKYKGKDKDLILNLAYHMFCSIMEWHKGDIEDDDNGMVKALALMLDKNRLIENLKAPKSEKRIRLVYISSTSNKEYNLILSKMPITGVRTNWYVEVEYGKIGKGMTHEVKLQADNLQEAQEAFLELLKDKLASGYEFDGSVPKIKAKMNG